MIKVTVRRNVANPPPGKRVEVSLQDDTFTTFLNKCSLELSISARKVFDSSGTLINMLPDIANNEIYYVSEVHFNFIVIYHLGRSICANLGSKTVYY